MVRCNCIALVCALRGEYMGEKVLVCCRSAWMRTSIVIAACTLASATVTAAPPPPAGAAGRNGPLNNPKTVHRLEITKPGVYENFIIDGQGAGGNLVKITASDVTLRNCEIFNGTGNGIGVFAENVTIENCHIHHMLSGSFKEQHDAHGITGRWGNVTIRNCEIHHASGDSVQFDPDRASRGQVTIEHCTFWTGPLDKDYSGFHKGETPGENAFDSKTTPDGERCRIIIRDSYFRGWQQPGQIDNMAALNLKENIAATITNCVFQHHENAMRVRGPGSRGGAQVEIIDCAIYDCTTGVRIEDKIEDLKIRGLAFADDVKQKYLEAGGGPGPGYINEGEQKAGPLNDRITSTKP